MNLAGLSGFLKLVVQLTQLWISFKDGVIFYSRNWLRPYFDGQFSAKRDSVLPVKV